MGAQDTTPHRPVRGGHSQEAGDTADEQDGKAAPEDFKREKEKKLWQSVRKIKPGMNICFRK